MVSGFRVETAQLVVASVADNTQNAMQRCGVGCRMTSGHLRSIRWVRDKCIYLSLVHKMGNRRRPHCACMCDTMQQQHHTHNNRNYIRTQPIPDRSIFIPDRYRPIADQFIQLSTIAVNTAIFSCELKQSNRLCWYRTNRLNHGRVARFFRFFKNIQTENNSGTI